MQYRKIPGNSEKLSALGFGCMRLPLKGNEHQSIDRERAKQMIRHAIDEGVNFIDTAWGYHQGESEPFLAEVLSDGYRDKVYLSTKLPSWLVTSREDMDWYLNEQLKRLNTDSIDFYMLHLLNDAQWRTFCSLDIFQFLDDIKTSGKARYVGFSFHDHVSVFKNIVDSYPWDVCLIQYNFLDVEYQAGTEGLGYAYDKGIGVFVMEPLRGGNLARNIPPKIQEIWDQAPDKKTPAEWALRWVWNDPRVSVVLSGMSTEEQIQHNIETAESAYPNSLSSEALQLIGKVRSEYRRRIKVSCTGCNYCMPCPSGVDIPGILSILNDAFMFENFEKGKRRYEQFMEGHEASLCTECGACEPACPQGIPIINSLKEADKLFGAT